ncbi:DUF2225 domain-containing protein [Clostridium fallax]|uniref:DUF2225 domain-containing protein n=1 Tax=Clostridium fallax TaxID=1533 RepID=A0A1M4YSN5_9CLOT|nr:DUF2225 domain-containing protein [Clostridium fallax]SHF08492.1 hypothetical protein SAMN05443638_13113 [Clostridium fallax]SQB06211.1 Uncharacterized protein conserved in bacteria (DUF2225) [Clostridium fallax]
MNSDQIYKKTIICPICKKESKVNMTKKGAFKILKQDFDMQITYEGVNPLFYSVFLCNYCGYANVDKYFENVKDLTKKNIILNITSKWKGITIPEENNLNFAIYLYKLVLLNRTYFEKKNYGELAVINLRLSWLYKEVNDLKQTNRFRENALNCFLESYYSEDSPIGGLYNDSYVEYLISVLYYSLDNLEEALKWTNKLIQNRNTPYKLKEKARDMKEIYKQINTIISKTFS